MRSSVDAQYWSFTAPVAGTYRIRLADQAVPYLLAAWYPGGSFSTYGSATDDRVRDVKLAAGARLEVSVQVVNGRYSAIQPYTVSVAPAN